MEVLYMEGFAKTPGGTVTPPPSRLHGGCVTDRNCILRVLYLQLTNRLPQGVQVYPKAAQAEGVGVVQPGSDNKLQDLPLHS